MKILVLTLASVVIFQAFVGLTLACKALQNGCSNDGECCGDMNCVKGVCQTCGQSGDSCLLDVECCNYDSSRANQVRYICSLDSTSCVATGIVSKSPAIASTTQQTVVANTNPASCAGDYLCPPGFYCVKNQQNAYSCKTISQVLDEKLLDYQNGSTLTTKGNGTLLVMKIYELSPNLKDHNASDMATIKQKMFTEHKDGLNVQESSLSINSNVHAGNLTEIKAAEQPLLNFFKALQPTLVIPKINPKREEHKRGSLIDQLFAEVNKEMNGEGNPFKEIEQTIKTLNQMFDQEAGIGDSAGTSQSRDPISLINKLYGNNDAKKAGGNGARALTSALLKEDNQINHVPEKKAAKDAAHKLNLINLMRKELEQDESSIAHLQQLLKEEATSTTTTTTPATTTTTHKSLWQSILALL